MKCELCGSNTVIINTVTYDDEIIRQRRCCACKHIFYTSETDTDHERGRRAVYNKRKMYRDRYKNQQEV